MKGKIPKILRVGLALVLALSLSLVMAVPVSATHTSSATVDFQAGASTVAGEASILDVTVTNNGASAGDINKVKIDFTTSDFTVTGPGTAPTGWSGTGPVDDVVTYTATGDGIAPDGNETFSPAVTNPLAIGDAAVPTVSTTDAGSKSAVDAAELTGWIGYVAISAGIGGNDITVEYVDPGLVGYTISVSVAIKAITVSLATDAGGTVTSTASEVAAAINAEAAAAALVDATADPENLEYVVQPLTVPALTGGTSPDVDKDCPVTPITLPVTTAFIVTATPGVYTSAALTSYDISFTTWLPIAGGETIVITFPAGYDLTGVDFTVLTGDVTMTVAGIDYTPTSIVSLANAVTIMASDAIAVGSDVVITFANDHVKNPPASGDYAINVATEAGDIDSDTVTIVPASFLVEPATVTAGTAFAITVTALNFDEGTDTGYTGAHFIDFSSAGTGQIPAFEGITFTTGAGTSDPANFILTDTSETPTITATEGSLTGTSDEITIAPGALDSFTMAGVPASVVAGVAFAGDVTVTAYDACGNVKTNYTGEVTWTSTDGSATLPAPYTFTSNGELDNGVHAFPGIGFTLVTVGEEPQTITVTDADVFEISGDVVVAAVAADHLSVSASKATIVANGTDASTITASALDEFNNVDTSYTTAITFETNLGELVDIVQSDGVATANLKSSQVGTATVKVTSGTLSTETVTVTLVEAVVVADIVVSVDKTVGANIYTVTATYVDADGETVTGADGATYTVTFSTVPEDGVTLDPADGVVVPGSGVATTTLTTTLGTGETITVTAAGIGLADSEVITVAVETCSITLVPGWNLISLPFVPTSSVITDVLAELIADETADQVRSYQQGLWYNWASTGPAGNLTSMEDGLGYWIQMNADDDLLVSGLEIPAPPAGPKSYDVYVGWNIIGFKSLTEIAADVYLDELSELMQAMYGYDAANGVYTIVTPATLLVPGQGYWLAVSAAGTIYP